MASVDDFKKYPLWQKLLLFWTHSGSEHVRDWLDGWYFDPLLVMPLLFLVILVTAMVEDPDAVAAVFAGVVYTSPVWLPFSLALLFWIFWIRYIRFMAWFKKEYVLLEVQLPAEVEKSPLAMEVFLTALRNAGGEPTFIARIWEGKMREIVSLEIAGNEGSVRFYMRLPKPWRNQVEARLYGQYPEAKLVEVDDYVEKVPFNLDDYNIYATEFKKSGDVDALPLKTYTDYKLDKDTDKPEVQVDPISNILEAMGNTRLGEHLWLQLVLRAHKNDEWYGFPGSDSYKDGAKEKINEILKSAAKRTGELSSQDEAKKTVNATPMNLSPDEKNKIELIERSLTKLTYDCGIRAALIAKKDRGDWYTNIGPMLLLFAPFQQAGYNSMGFASGIALLTDFNYPWQDVGNIRQNKQKRIQFRRYKERAFFYVPYDQRAAVLTVEELATLWHFPSSAVKTPSLNRVGSRVSEAPPNLPTGPGPANLPT
ncbi:MAG: hypothetical protein KGI70_01695 [Patescibacteria group bacterium]|nr:hypothetical protein [Patescibacteria group bacterium]